MIYSSTTGFVKPHIRKDARNAHLLPEARTRSKRILTGASEEAVKAQAYYPYWVEFYRCMQNGRQCTCVDESVEREKETTELGGASLSDFLLTLNEELPNEDYCPICFGTKLVGGYDRVGAFTLVLDGTLAPRPSKIRLEKDRPWVYRPTNKTGTLTWSNVELPTYFTDVLNVAIKWDEEPDEWSFTVDGVAVDKDSLESRKGEKVDFVLSMKDSVNDKAGLYAIFFQFEVTNGFIQADMPRKTVSYTGDLNVVDEVQGQVTINFDRSVGQVTTRDLIVDQDGYIYRITENERNNPMEVQVSNTCQSRLVRAWEKYFFMPSKVISRVYQEHNYSFVI